MENFTAYNPTRLHFGVGVTEDLGIRTKQYGSKALLVTGKGSVKKFGYFDIVVNQLQQAGIEVVEFSGIKPNPIIEDVREASELGRKENVDVIVALGGGSAVDSAKIISLSIASGHDGWDIMNNKAKAESCIPLICVLTLAATGTEMNAGAVVQNNATGQKIGYVNPLSFPKESFLDPAFTVSVPKNYTAYGIVDLVAHSLELYFGGGEPDLIDHFTFDIIKDAMKYGPPLLNDLQNVDLRGKILLDSTLALNGITGYGKKGGDWGVHGLGHELSLLYDLPHGATLSIVYIAWLKVHKDRCPERIIKLGQNLFGVITVDETIDRLSDFFKSLTSPVSLDEANIAADQKEIIIGQMNKNNVSGAHHKLSRDDHASLVELMYN